MNIHRVIITIVISTMVSFVFTQCATNKNMKQNIPIDIKEAYFQNNTEKNKNSGFDVYIKTGQNRDVILNYVYFKGKKIKLARQENNTIYMGHYSSISVPEDFIMSDDPNEEFKNKAPVVEQIPFKLKEGECVIIYTKANKEGNFKLDNLPEKKE